MLTAIEQAFGSDTGRHRQANEDSFFVRPPVYVVADGMGGAQAGEVASKTAADVFTGELPAGRPEQILRERIEAANTAIHRLAHSDASLTGMGTTLTAAVLVPEADEIVIGHVGDSRAYRLRGGKLEQLTRDHSLVEEMRRKGQITDEQAETHPQRSIITRALGPEPVVDVDVQTAALQADDVYMICSDGLTTMLPDDQIRRHLGGATSLEAGVKILIDEANRAGGRDNITVVLFRVGVPGDGVSAVDETGFSDHPTLIGASAEAAGLTAAEVRAAAGGVAAAGPSVGTAERARGISGPTPASPARSRRLMRRVLKSVVVLAVIGLVAFGAWWGARQVWFLGTDSGGRVALYQGLPYELPLGIELYSQRYSIPIQTASLPPRRQNVVTGHSMRSRDDAVSLINDILVSEAPEDNPASRDNPAPKSGTTGSEP